MGRFITHTIKSSIAAFLLASSSAACADGLPSGVGNSLPPDAQAAIATAKSLGITRELGRFYPLAVGATEQTVLDMTAAYAAIFNRGVYVTPTPFEEILGPNGELLWSRRVDGDSVAANTVRPVPAARNWGSTRSRSSATRLKPP